MLTGKNPLVDIGEIQELVQVLIVQGYAALALLAVLLGALLLKK